MEGYLFDNNSIKIVPTGFPHIVSLVKADRLRRGRSKLNAKKTIAYDDVT